MKALKCSVLLRVICIHCRRFHKLLMGASKANWFMPVSVCRICYILLHVIAYVCVCVRERLKCSSRGKVLTTLIILYFLQTWRSFCAPVSWDSLPLLIFFEIQFHFIPSLSSTYKTPSSIIPLTFISVLFDGQVRSKGQFGSLFCQWLQSIWEKGPFSEHLCVTER